MDQGRTSSCERVKSLVWGGREGPLGCSRRTGAELCWESVGAEGSPRHHHPPPSKAGAGVPASRGGPRGRVEAGRNPERQL